MDEPDEYTAPELPSPRQDLTQKATDRAARSDKELRELARCAAHGTFLHRKGWPKPLRPKPIFMRIYCSDVCIIFSKQ